jgi:hypothetical protein
MGITTLSVMFGKLGVSPSAKIYIKGHGERCPKEVMCTYEAKND